MFRRTALFSILLWQIAGLGAVASSAPLPMEQIAPGIYVHHGVTEEATPVNDDTIDAPTSRRISCTPSRSPITAPWW